MIVYDGQAWWKTCFSFRGTVLPRVLSRVGILTAYSVTLVMLHYFVLQPRGYPIPELDHLGHTVLGVSIGLLIVFRTNTSYARFWEARSHWGSLVNAARNLARGAAIYAGPADDLARLIAAYVVAIRENLRGHTDLTILRPLISGRLYEELRAAGNPPTLIARELSGWVAARYTAGRIDTIQLTHLEHLICQMVDAQGACEKISATPLPFVYAALMKQIIFLYLYSLPFVLVNKMAFAEPIVVAVVALGVLGIEEAGIEIEDPFGLDVNDLPLEQICATIARDTAALAPPK